MEKVYSRINWENYPSDTTPINETNLNKIDYAVNEIDDRVLELYEGQCKFSDTETILFTADASGNVSAEVAEGSIQEKHLQPDYLADIKTESASAAASAESAASSASAAKTSAEEAGKIQEDVNTALDSATELNDTALATLEDALASVKDYYERAEAMYSSLYLECDGETPALRAVTALSIDCGNPAQRALDDGGILFDGGTPTSRAVAS